MGKTRRACWRSWQGTDGILRLVNADRDSVAAPDVAHRGAPSPTVFWVPGTLMLWFGLWGVAEGSLGWAWVVWPVGLALLIIGAVAQGVAWGMDIHKERHP
jgi:hypothetical protein